MYKQPLTKDTEIDELDSATWNLKHKSSLSPKNDEMVNIVN